jgi:hypothetical protein
MRQQANGGDVRTPAFETRIIRQPMTNERVEDFLKNPSYEKRMVAFCDVLGWRSKIDKAGSDSEKIGGLRRQILFIARLISNVSETVGLRFSSFSDNIVISGPANDFTTAVFKFMLGDYQMTSAAFGFLTRGAITVGDVCHDKQVVFGPALNRAYELESTVANYPRIIFDRDMFRGPGKGKEKYMVAEDDECMFLSPFSVETLKFTDALGPVDEGYWDRVGLPKFGERQPIYESLKSCLIGIKPLLRSPLSDKDYKRVAWLYDRIANEMGVPRSASYPRVRLDCVQGEYGSDNTGGRGV